MVCLLFSIVLFLKFAYVSSNMLSGLWFWFISSMLDSFELSKFNFIEFMASENFELARLNER
jgi:hypothetical protein